MRLPKQKGSIIRGRTFAESTDVVASQYNCYSARRCSGNTLNHKDRHNCKRSGGKSWEDRDGTCYNL